MQDLNTLISMADKATQIAAQVEALKIELDVSMAPLAAAADNLSNSDLRKLVERMPDCYSKHAIRKTLARRMCGFLPDPTKKRLPDAT